MRCVGSIAFLGWISTSMADAYRRHADCQYCAHKFALNTVKKRTWSPKPTTLDKHGISLKTMAYFERRGTLPTSVASLGAGILTHFKKPGGRSSAPSSKKFPIS